MFLFAISEVWLGDIETETANMKKSISFSACLKGMYPSLNLAEVIRPIKWS